MSSKAHRRRAKTSVPVKQAFEENDIENKSDTQEVFNKNELSSSDNIELDRFYEKAFFTINDSTVEIILDHDILSWSTVSIETSHEKLYRRKTPNKDDTDSINLHDVYAISPIYNRWNWLLNNNENQTVSNISSSTDAHLSGFQLHSYERMDENILQEILVIFQSNLPNQIEQWYRLISKIIAEYKPSRNVLVICNPYAGSRYSRHVYNTKVKPMLERAQYSISYLEINNLCSADEVLNEFQGDFDSLYGLVIIGGDGSVINVINALLRYLAKENRTRLDTEHDLPPIPFPICIIPNGTTNIICQSIHGNTDPCTAILHLLFNQRMKIDMSAIFDDNYDFVTANFSAGAGYPANALKYFTRYSSFNPKKIIRKSFAKAASNKNLKPIEMEIRYIPVAQNDVTISRCYQGCPSCTPITIEETDNQVKIFDDSHIQKKGRRKKRPPSDNDNNHRSRKTPDQENKEKNWKILYQNYLQVAVLTNANLWSFAPQGLSKFGHLADGSLDLILIEPTTRKDFIRCVKRNGNSKNQYEFPFTNTIKVKEIEIELKLSNDNLTNEISHTDNQFDSSQSDDSSNEEQFTTENKSSFIQRHELRPPSAPMSEDNRRRRRRHQLNEQTHESSKHTLQLSKSIDTSILHYQNQGEKYSENEFDSPQIDPYSSNTSLRRKNFFQSLKLRKDKVPLPRSSSACGGDEKQNKKNRQSTGGALRPARSLLNLLKRTNSSSNINQDSSPSIRNNGSERRSSIVSRLSSAENGKTPTSVNNQYRNKKQPCMWNLDFTPYNSPLIRIKCFHRFLPVFGVGLDPDTTLKEINYSCFGRIG